MAFTRFHDDPCRIMKQLQEFTGPGMHTLQVPGNGTSMPFVNDPQVRMQKWGANRHNNFVQVESELLGMTNKLSIRDCFSATEPNASPVNYPTHKAEITGQSRTVTPAWEVRSVQQPRWETLHVDLQAHALVPFQYNHETRQAARDQFTASSGCRFVDRVRV